MRFSELSCLIALFLTACWKNASQQMHEEAGPFPPTVEQMWSENDPSHAELQNLGILPLSIRVNPSFLKLKAGEGGPILSASFEASGALADVDFEVIAPHLHESERASVDRNQRLLMPPTLRHGTEFIVRATLRNNPGIFDDLMVMINQPD